MCKRLCLSVDNRVSPHNATNSSKLHLNTFKCQIHITLDSLYTINMFFQQDTAGGLCSFCLRSWHTSPPCRWINWSQCSWSMTSCCFYDEKTMRRHTELTTGEDGVRVVPTSSVARPQAWTSASSGGIGDLGCLLSKCCLKVFGSGIWVYKNTNTQVDS